MHETTNFQNYGFWVLKENGAADREKVMLFLFLSMGKSGNNRIMKV
jgi:hypothetical protein